MNLYDLLPPDEEPAFRPPVVPGPMLDVPPEPLPFVPEQAPYLPFQQPGALTSLLAPFAGRALQPQARGPGQPGIPPLALLLSGFLSGLGQRRVQEFNRQETERQELNRRSQTAAAERNRLNLELSREQRSERGRALREVREVSRREKEESSKRERETIEVPGTGRRVSLDSSLGQWLAARKPLSEFRDPEFGPQQRFNLTYEPDPMNPGKMRPVGSTYTAISGLRDDVRNDPDIKEFITVRDNYERVKAGAKSGTGIGDLAIIFAYMKVLDPTSVVRETEYKNAAEAIGKLEILKATPKRWVQGDKLTAEGRQGFLREIDRLYESKLASHQRAVDYYKNIARNMGVDPTMILRDFTAPSRVARDSTNSNGYKNVNGIRVRVR